MTEDENKQELIADFELEEIEYQEETESQAEMVAEGNNDSKIEDYCRNNKISNILPKCQNKSKPYSFLLNQRFYVLKLNKTKDFFDEHTFLSICFRFKRR